MNAVQRDGQLRDLIDGLRDTEATLADIAESRRKDGADIVGAEAAVAAAISYLRDLRYSGDVA
jgi:hypothetical protein